MIDNHNTRSGAAELERIARNAMINRGLEPDFPPEALRQVAALDGPAQVADAAVRDLRNLPWCSIDNDDSRDLDQLTVAEELPGGAVKVLVAIADVDALVKLKSAVDRHAEVNTTSVYTAAKIFPMLPEKLSTNLTSLSENEDRLAIVVELIVDAAGSVQNSDVYRAHVKNFAKLAYNSVAAWLEGRGPIPAHAARVDGLEQQLRLQDRVAQLMRAVRHEHGALELETIQPRAVVRDGDIVDLQQEEKNRAKELIEDFMIGANGVTARFLEKHQFPSIRRIVRSPERWEKIGNVAEKLGDPLPKEPDSRALAAFLLRRQQSDPIGFPDLSLTIVKLMGAGEYVVEIPGQATTGHFGLAVRDYTHSTAPNRRYPDLITQRLIKAALQGKSPPYDNVDLASLAAHCTAQEDAANKVERQVRKSAAAQFLSSRIGEVYDAIVTGASPKGTWVRVLHPPVEGKLVDGHAGVDVGDRISVRLLRVDVEHGFIDFARESRK